MIDRRALAVDLRQVCMRVSRRTRFETVGELAPHQFSVLAKLDHDGPKTPRQLADAECVSGPSMSRTIACLTDRGLLRREADPTDGRQAWLHLTDAGRAELSETRATRDEWMHERIERLSDEECEVLVQAQQILARVVER